MICSSFALSSSVPAAPVTDAIAAALLERLMQVEGMWADFLVAPEDTQFCRVFPEELPALAANADAWGRAAHVPLDYTTEVGDIPAAPFAARVELLPDFSRFPAVNPNFVAFHTVDDQGREVCYINYAATGAGWVEAASHEINEARVNGTCGAVSAPAPDGSRWDLEPCDPPQGSGTNGTANAVGPRFFGLTTEGPLDIEGAVAAPFLDLPAGYHSSDRGTFYGEAVSEARRAEVEAHGVRGRKQRKATT